MKPLPAGQILIPEAERQHELWTFGLSKRLAHVFESAKLHRLGDLHGLNMADLARYRNCGVATRKEIRCLVQQVQGAIGGKVEKAIAAPFSVPPHALDIDPFDLPISIRLAKILLQLNIGCLRDLHGRNPGELRFVRKCGKTTIAELTRLLQRAAAGEFQLPAKPFSTDQTAELLRVLHQSMAALPPREREILTLRLGGGSGAPETFRAISQRFKLSRVRIGQIETKSLNMTRKAGGPKLKLQLNGLARTCRKSGGPLTPELLIQWLGESAAQLPWPPAAYVGLLAKLEPGIRTLNSTHRPPPYGTFRAQKMGLANPISQTLKPQTLTIKT